MTFSTRSPRTSNELASSIFQQSLEKARQNTRRWLASLSDAEQDNDARGIYDALDHLNVLCNYGVIYAVITPKQAAYLQNLSHREKQRHRQTERIVTYQGQAIGMWDYLAPEYDDLYQLHRVRFTLDPVVVQNDLHIAPELLVRARQAVDDKWGRDEEGSPVNAWVGRNSRMDL